MLWEAKNVTSDISGRLMKRPAARQWGTQLYRPDGTAKWWAEPFADMGNFTEFESGTGVTAKFTENGSLRFVAATTSGSALTYRREAQPNDGDYIVGEDEGKCELRFMFKVNGELPAYSAGLVTDGFGVSVRADGADSCTIRFFSQGIYILQSTLAHTLIADTADAVDGKWHQIRIEVTDGDSANIWIDDTEFANNTYGPAQSLPTDWTARIDAVDTVDGLFEVELDRFMFSSGNDRFTADEIEVLTGWTSMPDSVPHMLISSGGTIYQDAGMQGILRSLCSAPEGDTIFIPWLYEILFAGSDGEVLRWSGTGKPKQISSDIKMPRHLIAGTAHQQRLYVTSKDSPLRVYFSGANNIYDWSDENFTSPTLQSSFIDIPESKGSRITCMLGDFYGLLLIWTNTSTWVWRSSGDPVNDGYLQQISKHVGCVGPRAADTVGSDVFFLSHDGVYAISTVQEYGDISSGALSAVIRGLWQNNNFLDQARIISSRRSCVVHVPSISKTFVTVRLQGDATVKEIYEFNHDTKQWFGPWTVECEAFDAMLVDVSGNPSLVIGTTDGRVATLTGDIKSDLLTTSYDFRIRSARLDGRSLDPGFIRKVKRWRALRLYVLPRGAWPVSITWNVDGSVEGGSDEISQNIYAEGILGTTFILGQSSLVSAERMAVITVPLDVRGRWFEFIVEQNGDGEDLVLVGFEVDFIPSEEDKDNN